MLAGSGNGRGKVRWRRGKRVLSTTAARRAGGGGISGWERGVRMRLRMETALAAAARTGRHGYLSAGGI